MNGSGYTYTDPSQYGGLPDSSHYDPTSTTQNNHNNDPLLHLMLGQYSTLFPSSSSRTNNTNTTTNNSTADDDFFGLAASSFLGDSTSASFGLSSHQQQQSSLTALLQRHQAPDVTYSSFYSSNKTSSSTPNLSDFFNTTDDNNNNAPLWLNDIHVSVPDISVEPISGSQMVERLQLKMNDIITKYIPCVLFLVDCQQELRRGMERRRRLSASNYYDLYVKNLPERFFNKNAVAFERDSLNMAYQELLKLRVESNKSIRLGHDAVKSSFLGGMKDGESWGLRKWLSRHGGALHVCTDLECILAACRKLDKNDHTTIQLAEVLRPMAESVLNKLRNDIPNSYQQHSSAHPYLPYFHRLEHALRNMSQFDPTSDGVICLDDSDDDDDIEVIETKPAAVRSRSKPTTAAVTAIHDDDDDSSSSSSGESEVEDLGEIAATTTWICMICHQTNLSGVSCVTCGHVESNASPSPSFEWPLPVTRPEAESAQNSANRLDELARLLENNQCYCIHIPRTSYWDRHKYSLVLRLFGDLLRRPESVHLLENVSDDVLIVNHQPPFSHIIKHCICWRDLCEGLEGTSGKIPDRSLYKWDLWDAKDLLQAIDLVILNHLAYGKAIEEGKSEHRSALNQLRKTLWKGIGDILNNVEPSQRKLFMPTRRSETSGFVVYKIQE